MEIVNGKSFEELWKATVEKCKYSQINNLLISGVLDYSDVDSPFINTYMSEAELLQLHEVPKALEFNHGNYINRFGDGYDFIINELKRKADSNRACFSLINMNDIIKSGDVPIPSFLLQQFGLSQDGKTLFLSSYFRAIEVSSFLPRNLAELAHAAKKIKKDFPSIKTLEVNMFIFTANCIDGFYCLRKSEIDSIPERKIMQLAMNNQYREIVKMLDEKKTNTESGIILTGIESLRGVLHDVENLKKERKSLLVDLCDTVLVKMKTLKDLRKSTSNHQQNLKDPTSDLSKSIQELINALEEEF